MAEAVSQQGNTVAVAPPPANETPNWNALAKTLNVNTPEEAQKRAWEIANFVGGVENDQNSELILKRGGMQVALKLTK
jgi:hypothetical protein